MDERGSREAFTRMGTLGIEEEYYVVDDHGRPTSGTDELVYESDPPAVLEGRLDHELFKCVIEAQTPTIDPSGGARDEPGVGVLYDLCIEWADGSVTHLTTGYRPRKS